MADLGHFWANFMHVVHKANFVFFYTKPEKPSIFVWPN